MSILSDLLHGQPSVITLARIISGEDSPPIRIARHYEDIESRGHRYIAFPFDTSIDQGGVIEVSLDDTFGVLPRFNGVKVFIELIIDSDLDSVIDTHGPFTFKYQRPGKGELIPGLKE